MRFTFLFCCWTMVGFGLRLWVGNAVCLWVYGDRGGAWPVASSVIGAVHVGNTDRAVEALSVAKDTVFRDRRVTGFGVRPYPSGAKVYIAQARGPEGAKRVTRLKKTRQCVAAVAHRGGTSGRAPARAPAHREHGALRASCPRGRARGSREGRRESGGGRSVDAGFSAARHPEA